MPAKQTQFYSEDEIKRICLEARKEWKKRLRTTFHSIAHAIPDARARLYPYFNEELAVLDWKKLFQAEQWTSDELLTLLWLRSMWEGKMYVKSREQSGLFPENWEMKQAIFYALAVSCYASHMIHEHFRKEYEPPASNPTPQPCFGS